MNGLGIAQSGLTAARAGIDTISNNLANQNTEGYKKQKVELSSGIVSGEGSGSGVGTGVQVNGITHVSSSIMLESINKRNSSASYYEELAGKMSQVEFLFSDNEDIGLLNDMQQFFAAANNLKNDSNNEAYKDIFVGTAESLVNNMQQLENGIIDLKEDTSRELGMDVEKVNSILEDIWSLNKQIGGQEHENPTLMDQRNLLEKELAKLTNFEIKYDETSGGTYYIKIGNHRILDDGGFRSLSYDSEKQAVMLDTLNINFDITQGKIGADLRFAAEEKNELDRVRDSLLVFASEFVEQVNDIYAESAKYDFVSTQFGTNPSDFATTPLLDNPELKGLNPGDVTFVVHLDEQEVREYTVNINLTTTLEDLQKNLDQQVKDDFGGANDIFTFGSNGITSQFTLSSKYPIQIKDGNTEFNKIMGLNQFFEGDSLSTLRVSPSITKDPGNLFISDLNLNVNVNQGIADRLAQLQYQEIDFQKSAIFENLSILRPEDHQPDGEPCFDAATTYKSMKKQTFLEFMDNISFNVSKRTNNFKNSYNIENGVKESVEEKFDKMTKVNQDEELMELIKYQAAYNANAKVVSALDEMFDTILSMK